MQTRISKPQHESFGSELCSRRGLLHSASCPSCTRPGGLSPEGYSKLVCGRGDTECDDKVSRSWAREESGGEDAAEDAAGFHGTRCLWQPRPDPRRGRRKKVHRLKGMLHFPPSLAPVLLEPGANLHSRASLQSDTGSGNKET